MHYIFDALEEAKSDFTVKVSYLEIHNEELGDLLAAAGDVDDDAARGSKDSSASNKFADRSVAASAAERAKKLMLVDSAKGVVCNNLTETVCSSCEEVFACLRLGINARHVAETQMNKASSRSHSIFTVKIMVKELTVDGEQVRRRVEEERRKGVIEESKWQLRKRAACDSLGTLLRLEQKQNEQHRLLDVLSRPPSMLLRFDHLGAVRPAEPGGPRWLGVREPQRRDGRATARGGKHQPVAQLAGPRHQKPRRPRHQPHPLPRLQAHSVMRGGGARCLISK